MTGKKTQFNPAKPVAVHVRDLVKKYGKVTAVAGISFDIFEGEVFGLLGPNGAGKTTTLSMLATIVKPTSGQARVNGFDVLKHPLAVRQSIGLVFQENSTDKLLTGRENLDFHAMLYGVPAGLRKKRVEEVLALTEMAERADDLLKTYSGGMRRRIEMGRGLLHRPKVLFLDEPTLGLDPQTRLHLWEYIEKLARKERMTIVLTTHYMEEAERLCDRIAIVDHGKLIALDTPENLKKSLGGDVVLLEAPQAPVSKLKKLPFVKSVRPVDGKIMVTVQDADRDLSPLLAAAGKIRGVQVRKASLNDVFLAFTGREIRDESKGE